MGSVGMATAFTIGGPPGQSLSITVKAVHDHRNFSSGSTINVTVPSPTTGGGLVDDSVQTGVHSKGVHWGALGESIDMRSMNMNYTIPLLKAQGRAGLGL